MHSWLKYWTSVRIFSISVPGPSSSMVVTKLPMVQICSSLYPAYLERVEMMLWGLSEVSKSYFQCACVKVFPARNELIVRLCHTGPMTSCFRVSGWNFACVLPRLWTHHPESVGALISNPTVVLMMEGILDRLSRTGRSFRGAEIHHAADDTSLCLFHRPAKYRFTAAPVPPGVLRNML